MRQTTNEYRYFLESNFVGVNKLFVLIYSNHDYDAKRYKARWYDVPKGFIKNSNVAINGENFYDQSLNNNLILLTINFY